MAAKRVLITIALAGLMVSTGCRTWCERHYPCPQPVGYPNACVPCCPAPATSFAPPAPVPTANWSNPGPRSCTCTLQ